MLDRAWSGAFRLRRVVRRPEQNRRPSRFARRPRVEGLEGRQLLAASIAQPADVTVAPMAGYQVPLDGAASGATAQTFAVTSSNPDIKATVAQGDFVTVKVSHVASSTPGDVSFAGSFTYQLFQDLTPNTATRFDQFTNGALPGVSGSFNGTQFFRVVHNFDSSRPKGEPTNNVIQGGPQGASGNGKNPLELNPQLIFGQAGVVAVANAGPNTDGQQFFITTGPQPSLNGGYTIFGQVVSGQDIVDDIGKVTTHAATTGGEASAPDSPINIISATTSASSPDGVIHIDATSAKLGETATVTVTATDPADHTTATRTFKVLAGREGPISQPINQAVVQNTATPVALKFSPSAVAGVRSTASIVTQPAHGKITNLNAAAGTLTYTPDPGFTGVDTFKYQATQTNSNTTPPTTLTGNIATVTLRVGGPTGAVRQIGNVLVVTPLPRTDKGTNQINISQSGGTAGNLFVTVNGILDSIQPQSVTGNATAGISQIVVYGSKANDDVTIDPSVDKAVRVTLDGGHGGVNVLQAGAGDTREHGWFGQNTLAGGTGPNQLIGAAGHVRFKPTSTTTEIFAGTAHPGYYNYHSHNGRVSYQIQPPGGTFYKFVNGRITPIPTPKAHTAVHHSKA